MSRLSRDQVLKEKQTRDPNSITSLTLTHKALSDVSCLSDFNNLERLDLSFNNLTSLEGLSSCVNLKWLSVVQNKLQSLNGIEALSKLTVLNAGKNKLKSMDEVMSLVNLRALILNDNEIVSMCRLDQMKELNTLVLSRNPIQEIGKSLLRMKSIGKLSLSNCQIQIIGSSLKSCTELKELRLAHNDIKTLPSDLVHNKKLQTLDLGNNLIARWSDLKVLNSLVSLKNLNLQGNPVAEYNKLAKKVKKMLPNLHIFNAKLIDENTKNEKSEIVDDSLNTVDNKPKVHKEKKRDHNTEADFKQHELSQNEMEVEMKRKKKITKDISSKKDSEVEKNLKKNPKEKAGKLKDICAEKSPEGHVMDQNTDGHLNDYRDADTKKVSKRKRNKTSEELLNKDIPVNDDDKRAEKKQKKRSEEKRELDVIDDGETSFFNLFSDTISENARLDSNNNMVDETFQLNSVNALVTSSAKRKKTKNRDMDPAQQLPVEVGLGGPSTWGDG